MHPILFEISGFTIHTIWIFNVVAIISFTYYLIRLSIKNGLKLQFISEHSWALIFFALVGARIVGITVNYQSYFYSFEFNTIFRLFHIWDQGLNSYGTIIGFVTYLYIICKKNDQDFWKWMDTIVPATIIALAITHIGAFFEGVHYGKETSLPWGVNFESPSIKYTVPIHPTQIYSFLYSAVLATILLISIQTKKLRTKKITGVIALLGISAYGFLRFLEEFLRGDDTWLIFGIRFPQIIALIIFISAGLLAKKRYKNQIIKS